MGQPNPRTTLSLVQRSRVEGYAVSTGASIDRESAFYEFAFFSLKIREIFFPNFKNPRWILFRNSTLILTEKLQSHFFAITETLKSDKSDSNQCYFEFY